MRATQLNHSPRPPVPVRGSDQAKTFLREVVRRDIRDYTESRQKNKERARAAANRLMQLDAHSETVSQVAYTCNRIEKLLKRLETEARVEEPVDVEEPMFGQQKEDAEAAEEYDEVRALRAFAADDTTLETSSVADYSADPPAAPLFSPTCIEEGALGVQMAIKKAKDSVQTLRNAVADHPQWWNSAIMIRRLKTHAIRANYHSRKVKKWGDQCRSHLFVSSSVLNRTAMEATKELRDMKKQQSTIDERVEKNQGSRSDVEQASRELQAEVAELAERKVELEQEMCDRVTKKSRHLVIDPQLAESVLLLHRLEPAEDMSEVVARLSDWLTTQKMITIPPSATM